MAIVPDLGIRTGDLSDTISGLWPVAHPSRWWQHKLLKDSVLDPDVSLRPPDKAPQPCLNAIFTITSRASIYIYYLYGSVLHATNGSLGEGTAIEPSLEHRRRETPKGQDEQADKRRCDGGNV